MGKRKAVSASVDLGRTVPKAEADSASGKRVRSSVSRSKSPGGDVQEKLQSVTFHGVLSRTEIENCVRRLNAGEFKVNRTA